jgi:hypothetical protein
MATYAERLMFGEPSSQAGTGFISVGGLDGRRIANFKPVKPKKKELGQFLSELGLDKSRRITIPGVGTGYYDDLGNVYGQGDNGTWVKSLDNTQFSRLQANRKLSIEEKKKLAELGDGSNYQPPRLLGVPDAPDTLGNLPSKTREKIREKEYLAASKTAKRNRWRIWQQRLDVSKSLMQLTILVDSPACQSSILFADSSTPNFRRWNQSLHPSFPRCANQAPALRPTLMLACSSRQLLGLARGKRQTTQLHKL